MLFIHCLSFFLSLFPLNVIRWFAKGLGYLGFLLSPSRKKIALKNIEDCYPNISKQQQRKMALDSFQSLAITCLEMFWIYYRRKSFKKMMAFKNAGLMLDFIKRRQPMIFLIAHQGSWEFSLMYLSTLCPGTGVARSFKHNKSIYHFCIQVRQMFGAKIIDAKNAISNCIKGIERGEIVAMVDTAKRSKYVYNFFGRPAPTSHAPALLAYQTGAPLVVLTNKRTSTGYEVSISPFFYPDRQKPFKEEVKRLMDSAMHYLEEGIKEAPGEWMWMHNRWKRKSKRNFFSAHPSECAPSLLKIRGRKDRQKELPLASGEYKTF